MKRIAEMKKSDIIFYAVIVAIWIGAFGYYLYNNTCNKVDSFLAANQFEEAYEAAKSNPIYKLAHSEMMGYVSAAAAAETSDYPTAKELLQPYCDEDFENADAMLEKILFTKMETAIENGEDSEELDAILSDFQVMLEADEENTYLDQLRDFLLGYWTTEDERYYFEMQLAGSSANHNFPDSGATGYYFINGVDYQVGETPETAENELKFTLVSWDEISVYCYKDQQTYTMYRT